MQALTSYGLARRGLDVICLLGFGYLLVFWVSSPDRSDAPVFDTLAAAFTGGMYNVALWIWVTAVMMTLFVRELIALHGAEAWGEGTGQFQGLRLAASVLGLVALVAATAGIWALSQSDVALIAMD
jgi:hypothetical protein